MGLWSAYFAFQNKYDLKTISKEDVIKIIDPKIEDILKEAKNKKYLAEKTKMDEEAHIRKIISRSENDQLNFCVGDFI